MDGALRRRAAPLLSRDANPSNLGDYEPGDVAFIVVAGAMVSFMIPGLAFLYSGLARRKSALSLIWAVSASNAVVIFQWFFWGYSLAFSSSATNGYIGNLRNFGLRKVGGDPSPGSPLIPELLYAFYQMEFACVTIGILMGGLAERGRVFPAMLFSFAWLTLVYCPLACWAWSTNGWGFTWGVLDYAGGGPVEIGSGVAGLAYSWVLGRRQEKELLNFRPHNVSMVGLGTFILWFGWLGFNGGSAFGANLRAITAVWNSMMAAAMAGMVWCLLDWRIERKWTMVGFCSGTIAGLVAATPASGYIPVWAAMVMGIVVGAVCNYATKLKFFLRIDDALDLFAEHAIGGIVGLLFNAFFATADVIALDGVNTSARGGWLDRNWKQLYIQFAYVCATCAYTFVVTALIAKAIDCVPGLRLRATETAEALGMDEVEIGEFANDYIEVRRDFSDWTPPPAHSSAHQNGLTKTSSSPADSEKHFAAGDRHGRPETSVYDSPPPRRPPSIGNGEGNGNGELDGPHGVKGDRGGLGSIPEKPLVEDASSRRAD
ncbi:ammonium transporter [Gloeophyllum trabeum ATCC 11539]|uniref:Ammonium transporter n=1 Tax=Gloeophyllum trabeum (strain ATCC 11539 / FP-39264 / Madison 617) TaxID=670483 RepID=S7S526_GLOTA|nr:ammonium transporter [Gloeophyllum trabeum ATCC 11539]EPQ61029.1 ammonium transporter [Gloeophyllum trabeum ATCC 11539]